MNSDLTVPIIGIVQSPFHEKFGIPRQPNLVQVPAVIEFNPPYDNELAFVGLEAFSHLWLIWQFHQNKNDSQKSTDTPQFRAQIRPPRLGGNQKIGIFASRSMYRPSPLGLSVVELVKVIKQNGKAKLLIRGADLLNGTPIIDIKPYIAYSDAIPHAISGFASESPALLPVHWQPLAQQQAQQLMQTQQFSTEQQGIISELLALDPRPAYQCDEERVYGMAYDRVDVSFSVINQQVIVLSITVQSISQIDLNSR